MARPPTPGPQQRPVTPPPVAPPADPPAPSPVNTETTELEQVVRGGMNARQAITAILGADALTGDIEADAIHAMAAIDEWQRLLPWRRGLILHALHGRVHERAASDPNPAKRDPWVYVALLVGRAIPTVRKWSHPPGWEDDQD